MTRKSKKITPKQPVTPQESLGETEINISSEKLISVMSLCDWKLTLTRDEKGTRPHWEFDGFGKIKLIPYGQLIQIFEAHPTFIDGGAYYVMDKRVIEKHGLQPIYDGILSKEKIEKILSGNDVDACVDLYKNASNTQKEIIESMLLKKIRQGEFRDLGSISKFSKVAGKDFNKIAEQQKEFREQWRADNLPNVDKLE